MYKILTLFLLPLMVFSENTMKCEVGKCAISPSEMKNIPTKEENNSAMKCEVGKCAIVQTIKKDIPEKIDNASSMKCEEGKCASDDSSMLKKIPTKPTTSKRETIEQLFNVKTVQVKKLVTAPKQVNYGYIVAQDSKKVDVLTWYSGFVDTLYADTMYKKVKKGEHLAKVYSPEVYQAKQDYLNSLNYNMDHTAPAMLQSSMTKLTLLGVSRQEIQQIKEKRKVDEFTMVYAPISGWIFEKNINQGSAFNATKKLFQIINLEQVWAEIKLFQNELKTLASLTDFKIILKSMNKTYKAEKSLLYPMIDSKEATATLRLIIDNEEELLKPGMYVKMHASSATKSRLVIPRTAAIRKNGIWYAFLATEFKGEYEPVKIEIKPLDNKNYEVLNGLSLTDTIVNNALFMMDSDAQINGIY